jgi:lipid-A-disaccharide synthase-like uncharacterized protein
MLDLSMWTLLGALGFWCMELSYMPQIYRLWRRKQADDVSVMFPTLNVIGRIMAFGYAMHQGQAVFAFGFLAGSLVRLTFMSQVIYYRRLYTQDAAARSSQLHTSHAS